MASMPVFTVQEKCRISPPASTLPQKSLPLTFFDMTWILFPPVHYLFFYEFPFSKAHFVEMVVPKLKHSLSITLRHFFPFAGKLVVFRTPDTRKPEICYAEGDSVTFTFAECALDFNDLVGNHARNCAKFYPLVPLLGCVTRDSDCVKIPLFSVQVTFFPNSGFSIGVTRHHVLGDASTTFAFFKAWTSIARSGGDESFLAKGPLPFYDKVIKEDRLDEIKLSQMRLDPLFKEAYQLPSLVGPTDKVRATFILTRAVINWLKKYVSSQQPSLKYVTSFSVGSAYIWSCIAKSRIYIGDKKNKDELEQLIVTVDCRSRLDPPIPTTYFGNCGAPCIATTKSVLLTEKEGFATAAKLVGEALDKMLNNKGGILKDAERWHEGFKGVPTKIGIAGTTKLNFYDTDFGWGKPKKFEIVSIDYNGSISINGCKESSEDLEFGLCLPATQMEAFAVMFNAGLEATTV